MLAASRAVVHVNEPFNRRHPPGGSPGILRVPRPLAYQYIGAHNEHLFLPGFADLLALRYHVLAELGRNRGAYDLAKAAKCLGQFATGRVAKRVPVIDDPYLVFNAEWLQRRFDCQVVFVVRHPAGVVSSLKRIGTGWSDSLPAIAAQPELVHRYFPNRESELDTLLTAEFDPISHGALLWTLIHAAILEQLASSPNSIVVRYEDLATHPLTAFRDLYDRLDLPFTERTFRIVQAATRATRNAREAPWGRVGLSRTAYQPMDSNANAWAWRTRLPQSEIDHIVAQTSATARHFYRPHELTPLTTSSPAPAPHASTVHLQPTRFGFARGALTRLAVLASWLGDFLGGPNS